MAAMSNQHPLTPMDLQNAQHIGTPVDFKEYHKAVKDAEKAHARVGVLLNPSSHKQQRTKLHNRSDSSTTALHSHDMISSRPFQVRELEAEAESLARELATSEAQGKVCTVIWGVCTVIWGLLKRGHTVAHTV